MFNIREIRESMGLTQQQLADMCGVTSTYISQLERGKRSASPALERIIALELEKRATGASTGAQVTAGRDATVAVGHGATATNGGDAAALIEQLIAKVDTLAADHADIKALLVKLAAK